MGLTRVTGMLFFAIKQFGEWIRIDERLGAQHPDGCGHAH